MDAVHYVSTPDLLTAEVMELRLIARLRPRYNHAFTRTAKYCYVRLTLSEQWPRLVIASRIAKTVASSADIYLGPISTRAMARDVVDAIESVIPLRRCTVRMGRKYRAPEDAPVCSAAQLGLALCPCSGTADPQEYAREVERVVGAMMGEAKEVVEKLTIKMRKYSQDQRFEEAGDVLARIDALETVLRRVQTARDLIAAGSFEFTAQNISYRIECGLLQATHIDGAEFKPVAPPLPRDLSELFHAPTSALLAAAPSSTPIAPAALTTMPIAPELIDEILCIARHTRTT
jgi:DNA polymerase-3 subunit epsilon